MNKVMSATRVNYYYGSGDDAHSAVQSSTTTTAAVLETRKYEAEICRRFVQISCAKMQASRQSRSGARLYENLLILRLLAKARNNVTMLPYECADLLRQKPYPSVSREFSPRRRATRYDSGRYRNDNNDDDDNNDYLKPPTTKEAQNPTGNVGKSLDDNYDTDTDMDTVNDYEMTTNADCNNGGSDGIEDRNVGADDDDDADDDAFTIIANEGEDKEEDDFSTDIAHLNESINEDQQKRLDYENHSNGNDEIDSKRDGETVARECSSKMKCAQLMDCSEDYCTNNAAKQSDNIKRSTFCGRLYERVSRKSSTRDLFVNNEYTISPTSERCSSSSHRLTLAPLPSPFRNPHASAHDVHNDDLQDLHNLQNENIPNLTAIMCNPISPPLGTSIDSKLLLSSFVAATISVDAQQQRNTSGTDELGETKDPIHLFEASNQPTLSPNYCNCRTGAADYYGGAQSEIARRKRKTSGNGKLAVHEKRHCCENDEEEEDEPLGYGMQMSQNKDHDNNGVCRTEFNKINSPADYCENCGGQKLWKASENEQDPDYIMTVPDVDDDDYGMGDIQDVITISGCAGANAHNLSAWLIHETEQQRLQSYGSQSWARQQQQQQLKYGSQESRKNNYYRHQDTCEYVRNSADCFENKYSNDNENNMEKEDNEYGNETSLNLGSVNLSADWPHHSSLHQHQYHSQHHSQYSHHSYPLHSQHSHHSYPHHSQHHSPHHSQHQHQYHHYHRATGSYGSGATYWEQVVPVARRSHFFVGPLVGRVAETPYILMF